MRKITEKIHVPASVESVWEAWATEEGTRTFFAPACCIDLRPKGAYEMYFDLRAAEGLRGGEGCQVLAVQLNRMLSFTWNAPPSLPSVRGQYTHVTVTLKGNLEGTRVKLEHTGWGYGGEWDQAFEYFHVAWSKVVLPRLAYRFTVGPIAWENPPKL